MATQKYSPYATGADGPSDQLRKRNVPGAPAPAAPPAARDGEDKSKQKVGSAPAACRANG